MMGKVRVYRSLAEQLQGSCEHPQVVQVKTDTVMLISDIDTETETDSCL